MEAVFKSNRFLQTLLIILIMLIPTISMADSTTTIPITSSYWQSFAYYGDGVTGTMSTTSEGLKINGVGYRKGAGLSTVNTYNMVGATIYIKWKASGSGYMGIDVGISYSWVSGGTITTSLTTDHSYLGTTVISDNTWYYTRVKLNSDKTYTVVTATSNYDDSGGTAIQSLSGTYSGSSWSSYQSAQVVVALGDNYGGTSAYLVVGEAKIKFSVPMTSSYWQTFAIYGDGVTGTMSSTSDGMQINGAGYRKGAGLRTTSTYNFVGTETYIKWKAYGAGFMALNAGIVYDYYNGYGYLGTSDSSGNSLTTDHSYLGSTVISDSTWYYTRIKLNSNKTYTVVTASSNYDDSGGTTVLSSSGTYSGSYWSYFQSEYVYLAFGDNYGGTSAYMVVGEAVIKYLTSTTTTAASSSSTTTTATGSGSSTTTTASTGNSTTTTVSTTTTTANTSNSNSKVIYSLPYFHTNTNNVTYCILSNTSSDNTSAVTFAVKANSAGNPVGAVNEIASTGLYAKTTKMITFSGYSVTFGSTTLDLTSELSSAASSGAYGGLLSFYSTGTALNCTNVTVSCFQGTTNPRRNLAGYVCQDNSTAGSGSKSIVIGY